MKKYEEAEQDYLSGLKYKDIADKYGVSEGTVRQWKRRHWSKENVTKTVTKKDSVTKNVTKQKPTEKAIEELNDSELTDKQKAFVIDYLRISNATQAYINVYDVPYSTARVSGSRMLTNDNIKNEIKSLRKAKLQELGVDSFDLMEDMVIEARADIGDYLEFGASNQTDYEYDSKGKPDKSKPVLDDDGNPVVYRSSWVQFKDKEMIDTKAIKSIKMGKDGPVIELHDRNKARQELLNYLDKSAGDTDGVQVIGFDRRSEENERS
ncbi:terminase small subunit [Leuconostoc gelidum subsp. gasicomitatum]|uniref:terminase small subunit n=1 Tax=Leuconostoc gasicomitatum TaxID=115778 RepID=UPI001CC3AFD2|nr:terminase small subunit [Leuconostoc gasicomitatum]MBZ5943925.1 terminase small subunit [Leuconostoc gasicomitatum]MBZ5973034.1 terminase small subunit [Leuconostoc gasicomitatum]